MLTGNLGEANQVSPMFNTLTYVKEYFNSQSDEQVELHQYTFDTKKQPTAYSSKYVME